MPYSNSFFKSAASKILLPVIFLFLSCKKELAIIEPVQNEFSQKNEQLFFNKQHVQNATILRIIDDLKSKNSIEPFIDNLMPGAGYPRWDKTLITNDKTVHRSVSAPLDSTYIIPMVDASNSFVTGALIAYVGDTISYVATAMNDYRQLAINKTEYSKAMMMLDYKVFGHSSFSIKDSNLCGASKMIKFKNQAKSPASKSSTTSNITVPPDCQKIELWNNPNGDVCGCDGDESYTGWFFYYGPGCGALDMQLNYEVEVILPPDGWGGSGAPPPGYYPVPGGAPLPGGGSGGGPYVPDLSIEDKIIYLKTYLPLSPTEELWLVVNEIRAQELYEYYAPINDPAKGEILRTHLRYLIEYPHYAIFVNSYRSAFPADLSTWWENDDWAQANVNLIPDIPFLHVDENMFDPTIDLQKFINCFIQIPDAGATYQVKLCVDLPVNGSTFWPINATEKSPGHTFLTLTKTNGNQSLTQSVGYYPSGGLTSPGIFKNNGDPIKGGHQYNASLILENLSALNFNNIVQNLLLEQNTQYELSTHNCTSVAMGAFNLAVHPDVTIPPYIVTLPTIPPVTNAYLHSPQMLYKYIENFTASSTVTKQFNVKLKAPNSHGNCN